MLNSRFDIEYDLSPGVKVNVSLLLLMGNIQL